MFIKFDMKDLCIIVVGQFEFLATLKSRKFILHRAVC
jgi:hypothetical protein